MGNAVREAAGSVYCVALEEIDECRLSNLHVAKLLEIYAQPGEPTFWNNVASYCKLN